MEQGLCQSALFYLLYLQDTAFSVSPLPHVHYDALKLSVDTFLMIKLDNLD